MRLARLKSKLSAYFLQSSFRVKIVCAVLVVWWLEEWAFYREVSGSIPATSKLNSREAAVIKFVLCLLTLKKVRINFK